WNVSDIESPALTRWPKRYARSLSYQCAEAAGRGSSAADAWISKAHMPQFFRVAHNIDRHDTAAVMLERKGVDRTILLAQHQTGKAVHRRWAGLNGQQSRVLARDAGKEAQNFVGPVDRIESGSALAAAIGIKHGVFRQELGQRRDIALLGGGGECSSQTRALF